MSRRLPAGLTRLLIAVVTLLSPLLAMAEEHLVLAVHPYQAPLQLIEAYTPLADYLSEQLGVRVEVKIAADYQQHIDAIGRDQVDIAYLGPASYVKLVAQYGPKPLLARQALHGNPTFHGKIIVRRDSPLQQLSELRGKAFAFGDPASTMSHLVPRFMLWENGIKLDDLSRYGFLGSHDNVALAVLSGDYDAGAVKEAVFDKYRDRGLRALATTPALSDHLFVASSITPPARVEQLRALFYGLGQSAEGRQAMDSIKHGTTAMLPVADSDYENLRVILKQLHTMGVNY